MSDSNRVQLSYNVETAWGTNPAAAMRDIRYTGESLKQATNTVSSQEIRADRNIPDLLRVGINGDGDINIEMSHPESPGFLTDFLRGALMSAAWAASATTASISTTVASTGTYTATFTRASGDFTTTFAVGQWGKADTGFNVANVVPFKVTAVTTTVLTVVAASTFVGETFTGTLTRGAYIRNGTAVPTVADSFNNSFSIQKKFQDLGSADPNGEYELMKGAVIDRLSMTVAADQVVTASFSVLAKNVVSASSTGSTGAISAVGTQNVYSGVDDVTACLEGAAAATLAPLGLTNFTMQLQNNLRSRLEVGQLGAVSIGAGSANVTGTLQAYYSSKTIVDKYLAGTAAALALIFEDSSGDKMIIDFPRIKYTSGQRVATGINTDILMDMAFQALYGSATEPWTIAITRL